MKRALRMPGWSMLFALVLLGCSGEGNPVLGPGPVIYTDAGGLAPRTVVHVVDDGAGLDGGGGPVGPVTADPATGIFDPAKVYAIVKDKQKNALGIFDPTSLSVVYYADYGNIRPIDGALIYNSGIKQVEQIYKFVPDDPSVGIDHYSDNDIPVAWPTCPKNTYYTGLMAPESGNLIYMCGPCSQDACTYLYADGTSFDVNQQYPYLFWKKAIGLGYGGKYLLESASPSETNYQDPSLSKSGVYLYILNGKTGKEIGVAIEPKDYIVATRASSTGFWLVESPPDNLTGWVRWYTSYDGTKIEEKAIPVLAGYESKAGSVAIDSNGRIVAAFSKNERASIVRLDPDSKKGEILVTEEQLGNMDVWGLTTGYGLTGISSYEYDY
jgi:hypothetical protein